MKIDIHTHILPEVDDGSTSYDISYEMLKLEISNDVETVVLTPHYFINCFEETDKEKLKSKFLEFKERFKDMNLNFVFGAELYYTQELMRKISRHEVITLGDSNYILIEFSLVQNFYDIANVMLEITYAGYKPILAHPERYQYLSINKIERIKENGGLIQINTSSVLGDFGINVQKRAFELIKKNLVDFVASDAHSLGVRKPNLSQTLEFIKKKFNKEITNDIKL